MALAVCRKHLTFTRSFFTSSRALNGYIVLVPEIGEDVSERNPLYQTDGLPEFSNITIENCRAAIAKQTLDFEAGVHKIEDELATASCTDIFQQVFEPLEELNCPLDTTWGLSKTLYLGNSTLMPTSTYLAIHERARRARAAKFNSLGIYNAVKNEITAETKRTSENNRILKKFYVEGKLNGLDLSESNRSLHLEYLNKLTQEKAKFKGKTEVSTKQFSQFIGDPNIVREFPENLLKSIASDPTQPHKGPWRLTLQPHIYLPLMEHCPDRDIRWNLWQAFVGRGSGYGDQELATSLNLEEIRFVKRDIAKLLGYETYLDMSLETKMAGSVEAIKSLFNFLLEHAKPAQEKEVCNLLDFATERGFNSDRLELWDVPYWRRKQLRSLYDYDENKLKEYFPLKNVLEGLFQLCEKLFNIVIKTRTNVTAWHKDVKFYDIFEPHSSAPVAGFYFDPYARTDEKARIENTGWMVGIQNKSQITQTKPLAALIFNFEPPAANKASHLTFKEVKSLFHKVGHALQHLLTRTTFSDVAGLSNVEWDAVEVSGYLMSHWLYNKEVIKSISSHCDSADNLPEQMFQSLLASQQHLAGVDLCRELYLSDLDLELHSSKDYWLDILKRLWPEYRCFTLHKIDSHPCSFTHIFTDEWGAAYYSHIWARVIAADVYSAFHEVLGDEQQLKDVGKRYRNTFLALGGSEHPSQIFREFRGRDPSHKALLKSLGLKKGKSELL